MLYELIGIVSTTYTELFKLPILTPTQVRPGRIAEVKEYGRPS